MPTVHIEASKGEIADVVIMPGDPLRAKYIADNFLCKVLLVYIREERYLLWVVVWAALALASILMSFIIFAVWKV